MLEISSLHKITLGLYCILYNQVSHTVISKDKYTYSMEINKLY